MSKPEEATMAAKLERLEQDVDKLHGLAQSGCCPVNSRGDKDIFGRQFALPVDAEHKATAIRIPSFSGSHMRAFHTSWFSFWSGFLATFAAAPLTAYMEKPGSLNLTKQDIALGSILSVSGTIVLRSIMGYVMDIFGARKGLVALTLMCTPGVLGMMFVTEATGYIVCRCLIGCSLACFVASQTWCAQMFSKSIIGVVNATAAGWGNLGGGITNLTMPLIFLGMMSATNNNEDLSWRLAYIVPLITQLLIIPMAMLSRDLPDGNYAELEDSGAKQKSKGAAVLKVGLSNVNAWILTLTYGMCFGVELTMNNVTAKYFYDYHGLSPAIAGLFASMFGLMNICARSIGGYLSDVANKSAGMRGRLWSCWLIQSLEGLLCIIMGGITVGYSAPDETRMIQGWTQIGAKWHAVADTEIPFCGTKQLLPSEKAMTELGLKYELLMVATPTDEYVAGGTACISNSSTAGITLFVMICFSIFVQMAEGLHYGIVPYVSRPALGIVSGMVGAGGSLGSVITLRAFFFGELRKDEGILYMGITIIALTGLLIFVYFPDKGGMLFKAGGLGSYDPQVIKPPEGYRGADSMDFAALKTETNKESKEEVKSADVQVAAA